MDKLTHDPARFPLSLLPRNRSTPDSTPNLELPISLNIGATREVTRRRKWNRSGDIPITILVIGIILICSIAIISFFSSTIKERNSFVGINLMEQMNAQIEEKIFSNENPAGLYIEKKETQGILFWEKEVFLFSVEYKNPSS